MTIIQRSAGRIQLEWDEHTDKVSRRSSRWAVTDRGWLFASNIKRNVQWKDSAVRVTFDLSPNSDYRSSTLGHYLDYGPCGPHYAERHNGCTVHAVSCVSRESSWHATVAEAKTWIETQARVHDYLREREPARGTR